MKDLIVIDQPELPSEWNYEESIEKVQQVIYKWKNLTAELARELWIAREILRAQGQRSDLTSEQRLRSWSQYCQDIDSSKQVINRWLNRFFPQEPIEIESPLLPEGKFAVIYADCPWQYSNSGFDQSAQAHYPTMPIEEIKQLKDDAGKVIKDLATDQTVLFLWATNPLVPEAVSVLQQWGFEFKTNMAWIKDKGPGIGWFVKSKHELVFIGVRENTPKPKEKFDSWFRASSSIHSKKPSLVYELIEAMYPGPLDQTYYVELFARETRKGWKGWGLEL